MMKELALHVLDIAENSVRGEASHIGITITEDRRNNRFAMEIDDDGKGISPEILNTIKRSIYHHQELCGRLDWGFRFSTIPAGSATGTWT
ncbi:MAG: ATP-binding protein [Clostridia bacterium]